MVSFSFVDTVCKWFLGGFCMKKSEAKKMAKKVIDHANKYGLPLKDKKKKSS